jgi:hypothetical protein
VDCGLEEALLEVSLSRSISCIRIDGPANEGSYEKPRHHVLHGGHRVMIEIDISGLPEPGMKLSIIVASWLRCIYLHIGNFYLKNESSSYVHFIRY